MMVLKCVLLEMLAIQGLQMQTLYTYVRIYIDSMPMFPLFRFFWKKNTLLMYNKSTKVCFLQAFCLFANYVEKISNTAKSVFENFCDYF